LLPLEVTGLGTFLVSWGAGSGGKQDGLLVGEARWCSVAG
jgi:hypothetical protein